MLTPHKIQDKLQDISRQAATGNAFSLRIAHNLKHTLYKEVLEEIAKGSIDARSLALAALEKL